MTPSAASRSIGNAERICSERGVRLTTQRRRVLEILLNADRPLGAYEILQQLSVGVASAKPPTVYRALEFLRRQGLVHRLESINAFVGCLHPDHPHSGQFLICRDCGLVQEMEDRAVEQLLGRAIRASGFEPESRVIEVTGRCARCLAGPSREV